MAHEQSIFVNRLHKIKEVNSKSLDFVNKDLYKLVSKEQALLAGYEKIKSNKEGLSLGEDGESLDRWKVTRLSECRNALKNESWKPLPARSVWLLKHRKRGVHTAEVCKATLQIQEAEVKIVQSVLALILKAIYEPTFSQRSFPSTPKRNKHDALKDIAKKYDGIVFAIQGTVEGMYEKGNHHQLIELIRKRIKDDRLIRLIWKLVRAGYMDGERTIDSYSASVTLERSIVSPILTTIYLHEFDRFMEKICESAEKRVPNRSTVAYKQIDFSIRQIKRTMHGKQSSLQEGERCAEEVPTLRKEGVSSKMCCDCHQSDRIVYTRHGADFLIGIAGTLQLATDLKEKVRLFLETLSLQAKFATSSNSEKSQVIQLRKEKAHFLGHSIGIESRVKRARLSVRRSSPFIRRVTHRFVKMTASISCIISRLSEKGFCDRKGFPTSKKGWITQEDNQIINLYNLSSRRLFSYYSGVERKYPLSRIKYIYKFSCALTLAAKHSCSLAKIFTKHGTQLRVAYGESGEKGISLYEPDLKSKSKVWQTGKQLADPY